MSTPANTRPPATLLTRDEILIALSSLGEDPKANRVDELRPLIDASALPADEREEAVRQAVDAARKQVDAARAERRIASEKTFEVGGVAFAAVRVMQPRPHWRLRIEESGEVYEPGTGGISTESVPKMRSDVEQLFRRLSNGDPVDFRARFNLPEPGASADLVALASAFQAVYYTGKRMPMRTADLEACWGSDVVEAIERHIEGGSSRRAGISTAEESLLGDTLQDIWRAVERGEPYSAQVMRGPEFNAARTAAKRFAPDWKRCVAPYEERYAQMREAESRGLNDVARQSGSEGKMLQRELVADAILVHEDAGTVVHSFLSAAEARNWLDAASANRSGGGALRSR